MGDGILITHVEIAELDPKTERVILSVNYEHKQEAKTTLLSAPLTTTESIVHTVFQHLRELNPKEEHPLDAYFGARITNEKITQEKLKTFFSDYKAKLRNFKQHTSGEDYFIQLDKLKHKKVTL